ncbi:hypothetical protein IQ07DRAFT_587228 [Pyrenochaeta sp. DS3sAY3a]|nr:hypothetical protein IQ07DRAFT_587228 [Pyrenochaeta sp. DS3sAY3a]
MFCLNIRESTPGPQNGPQMPGSYQYQSRRSRRQPRDPRYLHPVPRQGRSNSVASSPSSTSSEPSICEICGNVYSGVYSRGNLARHLRLKHGEKVVVYECEIPGCGREFFRQDARLKHYRKYHKHLVEEAPVTTFSRGGGPDLGISDLSNASALDTVW